MQIIVTLIAGLIFGIGLIISGMANPLKVQNFHDLFGTWDPSLAFVMGGAIAVTAPGYWLLKKFDKPIYADKFSWPTLRDIDARLLGGSAIFGIGWGMSGFCPEPALTALPMMASGTLYFTVAMLIGMWLSRFWVLKAPNIKPV